MTEDSIALRLNFLVETVFETPVTDRASLYSLIARRIKWAIPFDRCVMALGDGQSDQLQIAEAVLFIDGEWRGIPAGELPVKVIADLGEAFRGGVVACGDPSRRCSAVTHALAATEGKARGAIRFELSDASYSFFDIRLIHFLATFFSHCLDRMERQAVIEKQAAALQEALEESRKANGAKDIFLATLSHELRTPLSVMLSWTQLLQKGTLGAEKERHGIRKIEESGKVLNKIIEDLLEITRIQSGKLLLERVALDPCAEVRTALESMEEAAACKALRLSLHCASKLGKIFADSSRLQQILVNLLNNAIKFSENGGGIDVWIDQIEADGEDRCRIKVIDHGKGIDPEFLPKIFDYFSQEDGSPSRRHGGLGLGLAIVQNLVEMHGGEIQAGSDGLGKGAIFTVTFPVLRNDEAEPPLLAGSLATANSNQESREGSGRSNLEGMNVLVVDDDPAFCDVFSEMLKAEAVNVTAVNSVGAALGLVPVVKPNLIFSDIAMPEEDGYSLIRKIKEHEGQDEKSPPVIAVTAHASASDLSHALTAGFSAILIKPVEMPALLSVLGNLTSGSNTGSNFCG